MQNNGSQQSTKSRYKYIKWETNKLNMSTCAFDPALFLVYLVGDGTVAVSILSFVQCRVYDLRLRSTYQCSVPTTLYWVASPQLIELESIVPNVVLVLRTFHAFWLLNSIHPIQEPFNSNYYVQRKGNVVFLFPNWPPPPTRPWHSSYRPHSFY